MTAATSTHAKTGSTAPTFLQNGGGTGLLLREVDWSRHPLGAAERWPVILQAIPSVVLGSRQPMFVCWGPALHTLYNDGYAKICGTRHPASLGAPLLDIWHDIRDVLDPMLARVAAGEPIQMDNLSLILHNNGVEEEAHFAFSHTPLRDDTGTVSGLFCACSDTTREVRRKRELQSSEQVLRSVLGASTDCRKVLDLEGHLTCISDGGRLIMQLPPSEDVLGKLWPSFWKDVSGRQGLGLSLALHALCTNATKHGALSGDSGDVVVGWDVQPDGVFAFHWRESGGPPVAPPEKRGFGSVLIEKIVATYFDGSATLDFNPSGVAFHLSGKIALSAAPTVDNPQ